MAEKLIVGTVGTGGPWPKYSIVDSYKCIADLERQLQRATDLVRYMRSELHKAKLIDNEEYAALVADSESGQRVARLEGYDRIERQLAEAREAAAWTRIDAEHLPKAWDLVGAWVGDTWEIIQVRPSNVGRDWKYMGWTHYRPIAAPPHD